MNKYVYKHQPSVDNGDGTITCPPDMWGLLRWAWAIPDIKERVFMMSSILPTLPAYAVLLVAKNSPFHTRDNQTCDKVQIQGDYEKDVIIHVVEYGVKSNA